MFICILCKKYELELEELSSVEEMRVHLLQHHASEFSDLRSLQVQSKLLKLVCDSLCKIRVSNSLVKSLYHLKEALKRHKRIAGSQTQRIKRKADTIAGSFDEPLSSFKHLMFTIHRTFYRQQLTPVTDGVHCSLTEILYVCLYITSPYTYQSLNYLRSHPKLQQFFGTDVHLVDKMHMTAHAKRLLNILGRTDRRTKRIVFDLKVATLAFIYTLGIAKVDAKSNKHVCIDAKTPSANLEEVYTLK
ncbi:hypothetical protein EDC96DRAFT_549261 [Choanephora cucurbitarum]|nr:hypothetical protein EDC96DRAFT_549261 [Choanephora cucurbitarum]